MPGTYQKHCQSKTRRWRIPNNLNQAPKLLLTGDIINSYFNKLSSQKHSGYRYITHMFNLCSTKKWNYPFLFRPQQPNSMAVWNKELCFFALRRLELSFQSRSKLLIYRRSSAFWQINTVTIKLSTNLSRAIVCRSLPFSKILWLHLPRFIIQLTDTLSNTVTGVNIDRLATVVSHTF